MQIHPKFSQLPLVGNSMSQDEENREDHQQEGEDSHLICHWVHHQDKEVVEVVEEVGEVEVVEVEEGCFPLMAKHHKQQKNFLAMRPPSSQVTEPRLTPSLLNGSYTVMSM